MNENKRQCIVTLGVGKNKTKEEAIFCGVYQRAHTTVGILAGSVSGQYAEPVAVVEIKGQLIWVEVARVEFVDSSAEKEGCVYCKRGAPLNDAANCNFVAYVDYVDDEPTLAVEYDDPYVNDNVWCDIIFCPMCGKCLNEEQANE